MGMPSFIHVTTVMALPHNQVKHSLAYQMVIGRRKVWCALVSALSWLEPDWLLVWGALDMQYTSSMQSSNLHNLQIVQSSCAICRLCSQVVQSADCAVKLCNLQIVQSSCAICRLCSQVVQSADCAVKLCNLQIMVWKTSAMHTVRR